MFAARGPAVNNRLQPANRAAEVLASPNQLEPFGRLVGALVDALLAWTTTKRGMNHVVARAE